MRQQTTDTRRVGLGSSIVVSDRAVLQLQAALPRHYLLALDCADGEIFRLVCCSIIQVSDGGARGLQQMQRRRGHSIGFSPAVSQASAVVVELGKLS